MPFIGNIVNTVAVTVGALIGLALKRGISDRMQETLMQALGLCTVFIGISGALQSMFRITQDGADYVLSTGGTMLLIASAVIGTVIGQLIDIEGRLEALSEKLKQRVSKKGNNSRFTEGFVSSTLIICVGAMAIVGGINDGMGAPETLLAKSVLDFVVVLIFSSTMGVGVMFSAAVMFVYQGIFGVIGYFVGNIMSAEVISGMSIIGNVLIFGVGINLLLRNLLAEHQIRIGNMLPALAVPIVYSLIVNLIG